MRKALVLLVTLAVAGCGENKLPEAPPDQPGRDAGTANDAGTPGDVDAGEDAGEPEDAGELVDAGDEPDAGEDPDAGEEPDAGEPADAGESPDAGAPTCQRIVPTSQPLAWGECYSEDWPVYTGGKEHVLATWFTGVSNGASEWTDISDRGFYVAIPMSWVYLGRGQTGYNQTAYSLIRSSCSTGNFCDPPYTNIPPRPWGTQICVLSHDTGRHVLAELIDTGPADRLRTHLVDPYGAQTWIDLSPGAAAYLATGNAYGTPDNQIVTFWEGPCE